jgi:NhaP-type Na+/H+ or K+/H+ antiporter
VGVRQSEKLGMVVSLLTFAVALLIAVLLSKTAHQTVLSTAVIFLAAGFLLGKGALNLIEIHLDDGAISAFVEMALFSVLFADGMKIGAKDLLSAWKLPGRALLLGLPLTLLFMAILAHWIVGLRWLESFLIGAVLSPTDPVFASALVSRREVPTRLRRLLNVESGLNDGLALPIVLALLALLGVENFHPVQWITELLIGIALGIAVPWLALKLQQMKPFAVARLYKPLLGLAIGLLVYSLARLLHGNLFLAAFSTGITIATIDPDIREDFWRFAEPVAELLKLGAVLIFGALLSWKIFTAVGGWVYLYMILVLLAARPAALGLALIASPLDWRERLAAAWFGPRGFASVVYGLLVLGSGVPRAQNLFQVISIVIIGSIVAHSTTDVLMARWFRRQDTQEQEKQASRSEPKEKLEVTKRSG